MRADGGRTGALPRRVSTLGPFILLFLVPSGEASCSLLQPRVPGTNTSWGRTDCCTYRAVGAHGCTQRGWKYLVYPTGGGCASVYWSGYFCSFLEVGCTRMCTSGKVYMRVHMFSVYSPVCAHLDETGLITPVQASSCACTSGWFWTLWVPSQTSVFPSIVLTNCGCLHVCTVQAHLSMCVLAWVLAWVSYD